MYLCMMHVWHGDDMRWSIIKYVYVCVSTYLLHLEGEIHFLLSITCPILLLMHSIPSMHSLAWVISSFMTVMANENLVSLHCFDMDSLLAFPINLLHAYFLLPRNARNDPIFSARHTSIPTNFSLKSSRVAFESLLTPRTSDMFFSTSDIDALLHEAVYSMLVLCRLSLVQARIHSDPPCLTHPFYSSWFFKVARDVMAGC